MQLIFEKFCIVELDLRKKKNKITFWRDKIRVGEIPNIEKKKAYYAAVGFCCNKGSPYINNSMTFVKR